MRIIGLDLSLTGSHKAVVCDEGGRFVTGILTLHTQVEELLTLLQQARDGATANEPLAVVMEPTGYAWLPIASFLLRQENITVYLVNSQQVADLRRYYKKHAKSDRIDARVLAKLPLVSQDKLHPLQPAPAATFALQRACKQVDWLAQHIVALKNQLIALDRLVWLGSWEKHIFGDVFSPAARWCRRHYYQPQVVLTAGPTVIAEQWQAGQGEAAALWAAALVEQAIQVLAIFGHPAPYIDFAAVHAEVACKQAWLEQFEAQQTQLQQEEVHPRYRQLHPSRHLETLQGVGEDSAAVFISFIGDPTRFADGRHFRGWSGLVPRSAQSAESEGKGLSISQAGPDLVKKYAYLDANVARHWDPQLAKIYYEQMMHKGQHHNQAVCAVATHLLDRILVIAQQDRPYQLRDVDGTPVTKQQARQIVCDRYTVPKEVRQRNNRRKRRERSEGQAERRLARKQSG